MVSDGLGNVYALRSRDGVKIWRTSGSYVYGFVAVKGITYAATNTGLVALDSANGKVMRSFAVKGGVIQCAATKDHLVFAGSPSGIEVLDLLKWQVVASVPVVDARAGLAIVGTTLFTSVYTGSDRDPQTSELRAYHLPSD
jgi:outer membrane protein assembly factor BamB